MNGGNKKIIKDILIFFQFSALLYNEANPKQYMKEQVTIIVRQ